jgi:S1-C subfamily serine protease
MNFQQQLSLAIASTVIVLMQPLKAVALNAEEISTIARDITVKVIQAKTGNNGSGVIIERQEGKYSVLTNYHVAGEEGVYRVQTPDGTKHQVTSKQEIPGLDLMILTFDSGGEYRLAEMGNSEEVVPLQTIFVAGFPAIQNDLDLVSGQVRSIREDILINPEEGEGYALIYSNQTLPGSSGGAVVDEDGMLVAINGETERDPATGRDISRGIPINIYLAAVEQLTQKTQIAEAEQQRQAESKRLAAEAARARAAEKERLAAEAAAEIPVEEPEIPAENEDNDTVAALPPNNFPTQYLLANNLEGHQDIVNSVVISSDKKRVITGSWDNTIKVWNAQTGQLEQTLVGHESLVNSVALSGDGNTLVSGSDDGTVKVWNLQTGESRQTLTGHNDVVNSVAITLDGKTAVSASDDETIRVWNLETGKSKLSLTGHEDWINCVAISTDGTTVVSASSDETVRVWDLNNGKLERTLKGHTDVVNTVAISPDGTTIASGSDDETVKIWDWKAWELKHTFNTSGGWVNSVAISSDGKKVASGSDDSLIRVWSLENYQPLASLEGHEDLISSVALSLDAATIVSVSADKTVKIWQLQN